MNGHENTEMDNKQRKKRPRTAQQSNYVRRIKDVLLKALDLYDRSPGELKKELEEVYKFQINEGTLKKLFYDDSSIDIFCLVTVCKFFGIDYNELLAPMPVKDATERYTDIAEKINVKSYLGSNRILDNNGSEFWNSLSGALEKFPVLEDDGYLGDFTGYIVQPTDSSNIRQFELLLEKNEDGVMHATMNLHYRPNSQNLAGNNFIYKGIPLHAQAYNVVIMFLTDENKKGEFYFLAMGFERYRSNSGLIFRQGLSITGEGFDRSTVVSQNFIIFRNPQKRSKIEKYIGGLLKAPNNQFCIQVSEATKLAEKYPEVKNFLTKADHVIKRRTSEMIVISEDNILSSELSSIDKVERIKALLILKGHSKVENLYYYKANSKYSDFAISHLVDNEVEPENENKAPDE